MDVQFDDSGKNVLEAKNNLSRLIHMLEAGEEDNVIISRNGEPIVQMTLLPIPQKNLLSVWQKMTVILAGRRILTIWTMK